MRVTHADEAYRETLARFGTVIDFDLSSLDRTGVPVTSCSLAVDGRFAHHGNGYGATDQAARVSGLGELTEGVLGAYTVHSSMFDVWLMLVFGVVGYLFKKLKYPLAPMVLALVLGDMAEASFRQSMLLSQGSLSIFFANPLVAGITSLALIMVAWPWLGAAIARRRRA